MLVFCLHWFVGAIFVVWVNMRGSAIFGTMVAGTFVNCYGSLLFADRGDS
jgi:hypothetical protein